MNMPVTLYESSLSCLPLLAKGKVRDIYEINDAYLLIVTTDRLSAFDVILPEPIPGKGCVLTNVSNFWFHKMEAFIANHLVNIPLAEVITDASERERVQGRAIVVKRLTPLPIEAIVRGYLIGSGWKDYQKTGKICGLSLPEGLQQAEKLPEAIYTPSSKAELGAHDENVSFEKTVELVGLEIAEKVRDISLKIYKEAAEYAKSRGIMIADTKFEFGVDAHNKLYLIDEILTPDSSRFWAVDEYQMGMSPPSFDKQYIRDYLETLDWDKTEPAPSLPEAVRVTCAQKYQEAEHKLI
jgi:phosphoribosylaminoimidazole-succinocarboxamide synthase